MNISRRGALATAAATMASFGAGLPRLAQASDSSLVVGTWGGDYAELLRQMIDEPILKPQGVQVLQDIGGGDSRRTKLVAERGGRRSSMDIVLLSDSEMYLMAKQNVLETVDTSQVSRISAVEEKLRKPYSIPHLFSYRVILYNEKKVPNPPRSYAELADPKWRGRVGLSDILYLAYADSAALGAGGGSGNLDAAKEGLAAWKKAEMKVYPSNEALAAALKSEEVWITVMWMARGFMWQKAGIPLKAVIPAEGASAITFEAAVPKTSRKKDMAWKYLNAMLDAQAQVGFADRMGYIPTVADAKLPVSLEAQLGLPKGAKLLSPNYDALLSNQPALLDLWTRDFKG